MQLEQGQMPIDAVVNKFSLMSMSDNEQQWVTMNDNEWQWVTMSDNEWQ